MWLLLGTVVTVSSAVSSAVSTLLCLLQVLAQVLFQRSLHDQQALLIVL